MAKTYTEIDLGVLVADEWDLVGGLGAVVQKGVGIVATRREKPDSIWNHAEDVALPFPFTLDQFRAFCAWHPTVEWEVIEAPFTNDDGSLDEDALAELATRGTRAAELVRRFLERDPDGESLTTLAVHRSAAKRNIGQYVEPDSQAVANLVSAPRFKKDALIKKHTHHWPSIRRDIADGHQNGLSTYARAGKRGWNEQRALEWAKANGKHESLEQDAAPLSKALHNMATLTSTKHLLDG